MRVASQFGVWWGLCVCCLSLYANAFTLKNPSPLSRPSETAAAPSASVPAAATATAAAPAAAVAAGSATALGSSAAATGAAAGASVPFRGAQAISALTASAATPVFTAEQIKAILPHRFPFLMVDKVLEFEPGKRAVGVKQISNNEDQFNGHFPERAVMPGVLQVEALAQLAGIVALQQPLSDGKGLFFFAGANGIKWKRPVVPGDTLVMESELLSWKEKFGIAKFSGKGYVDGQLAVEVAEMTFAFGK